MAKIIYLFLLIGFITEYIQAETCADDPCVNGECLDAEDGSFTCVCQRSWAGIKCNYPQSVICGNKTIDIFIDQRVVTEQGLDEAAEFVHLANAKSCKAVAKDGGYHLKVNAPFTDCGMDLKHDGGDYRFSQQVIWNQGTEAVERPLVLLEFECSYQDEYTVSNGPIFPTVTTVEFKTSYGEFKVEVGLYGEKTFSEESKFKSRPVVTIGQDVCVQHVLKNVMPEHLVLTLLDCWASTKRDGTGDTHELITDKCKDDPTIEVLANGAASEAQFCFELFKWKDSMDEIFLQCMVNVCNVTAFPEYCTCPRSRRSVRAITSSQLKDSARTTYGPLTPVEENMFKELEANYFDEDSDSFSLESADDDVNRSTVLIAVGVVLVVALILLGVIVGVYINCKKRSINSKAFLRTEGETVVIPNPTASPMITPST